MKGVLLMAYGSPQSLDEVEAYYTHIRGGRKPTSEQLAELVGRYRAIGGSSPLLQITRRQAAGLRRLLSSEGSTTRVYAAMKHSPPFIPDVMREVKSDGVNELLCIVLAPHYSSMSIGGYMKAVDDALGNNGNFARIDFVKSWHMNPRLISAWSSMIGKAEERIGNDNWLIFTAHSLPERILAMGDPYKDQLLETASSIARKQGTGNWSYAFQSASMTGEPWLGPDILEHLEYLKNNNRRKFLIAPIGFVSDHLEILYDIDVETMSWARSNEVMVARCDSFNASDDLIHCLTSVTQERGFL